MRLQRLVTTEMGVYPDIQITDVNAIKEASNG